MPSFYVGSTWRTKARFKASGTLTDPTTITLNIRTPAGVETSYTHGGGTVTKESTGIFYKDIPIDAAGRWIARWEGSGAVPDAAEHEIDVVATHFTSP